MGDQEVHSNVLTVDVLVHHVPDSLGHHVRVQVCVVLQEYKQKQECVINRDGEVREGGTNVKCEEESNKVHLVG